MTPKIGTNSRISKFKTTLALPKPWDYVVIFLLSLLITIPVFIIFHHNIIDFYWAFHLDRILLFLFIFSIIFFSIYSLKTIAKVLIIIYLIILFYGTFIGNFGFVEVYEKYQSMVYAMAENPYPQDIVISKLLPFPNKNKILKAVDFKNKNLRNFAVKAATTHFHKSKYYAKNRVIIQCFSVFKVINNDWNYVSDPKFDEYIASASESLQHFSGDCDDHAILMAACIKAIGGTPRIIHTTGHLYPEILIGSKADFETIQYLIKKELFTNETKNQRLHYHIDERNQIWLNLDYTAKYPGGPFMYEEILGALTF